MKSKLLIIIVFLFCYPLISQENNQNLMIVTWEDIQVLDFTILSENSMETIIIVNGITYIVKKYC